ncbi:MAG TPA: hypothetical protein VE669_09885, partial [Actinomycetota bacterium]|nr:hypothetical protein [Actinomycetota bacterium]
GRAPSRVAASLDRVEPQISAPPFGGLLEVADRVHDVVEAEPGADEVQQGVHCPLGALEAVSEPRGIAWVEVGGDRERLRGWLGGEDLAIRVVDGAPGIRAVAIATADGELRIG